MGYVDSTHRRYSSLLGPEMCYGSISTLSYRICGRQEIPGSSTVRRTFQVYDIEEAYSIDIIAFGDDDADGQVDSIVAECVQWCTTKRETEWTGGCWNRKVLYRPIW